MFPPFGIPASKLPIQNSRDFAIITHEDISRREISMSEDNSMALCQRTFRVMCVSRRDTVIEVFKKPLIEFPLSVKRRSLNCCVRAREDGPTISSANVIAFLTAQLTDIAVKLLGDRLFLVSTENVPDVVQAFAGHIVHHDTNHFAIFPAHIVHLRYWNGCIGSNAPNVRSFVSGRSEAFVTTRSSLIRMIFAPMNGVDHLSLAVSYLGSRVRFFGFDFVPVQEFIFEIGRQLRSFFWLCLRRRCLSPARLHRLSQPRLLSGIQFDSSIQRCSGCCLERGLRSSPWSGKTEHCSWST